MNKNIYENDSVSVVIPTYNMSWCIERAIGRCQNQTVPVKEIIIVDDQSPDDTEAVVHHLMTSDKRIKYIRREKNGGHLATLREGLRHSHSDWTVLLDSDDELTPRSIEFRLKAAHEYFAAEQKYPGLIYGDHGIAGGEKEKVRRFPKLRGDVFQYLSKELHLCQSSTIMLGKAAIQYFPKRDNPWCTDDEMALSIAKHVPVVHSGEVVAVYYPHHSVTRMSNDPMRRFQGVRKLVNDHRGEIVQQHGIGRLLLWYLRLIYVFLTNYLEVINKRQRHKTYHGITALYYRLVGGSIRRVRPRLDSYLKPRFELNHW